MKRRVVFLCYFVSFFVRSCICFLFLGTGLAASLPSPSQPAMSSQMNVKSGGAGTLLVFFFAFLLLLFFFRLCCLFFSPFLRQKASIRSTATVFSVYLVPCTIFSVPCTRYECCSRR